MGLDDEEIKLLRKEISLLDLPVHLSTLLCSEAENLDDDVDEKSNPNGKEKYGHVK